jgi:predicted deacylase
MTAPARKRERTPQGQSERAPPFELDGTTIPPGRRVTVELPLPGLYTRTAVTMPVRVVQGRRLGPCLVVSAAVHGDEINGVEIIHRLLRLKSLNRLRGTLLAVPVVNVYGFLNHSRYLPDRRDLNRTFPGSDGGSLAARLAHLFLDRILKHADFCLDLHTASIHRTNLPQIRGCLNDPAVEKLAKAFGVPVILNSDLRDGSLRAAAEERGVPMLVYEGGEALRFDELAIRAGLSGVVAVLRELQMLPALRRHTQKPKVLVARSSTWVRAPESGIFRCRRPLGASVLEGELLGTIGDPFGDRETPVNSPAAGITICHTQLPLVSQGDALVHVARFRDPGAVEERVDAFQEALADSDELAHPLPAEQLDDSE